MTNPIQQPAPRPTVAECIKSLGTRWVLHPSNRPARKTEKPTTEYLKARWARMS